MIRIEWKQKIRKIAKKMSHYLQSLLSFKSLDAFVLRLIKAVFDSLSSIKVLSASFPPGSSNPFSGYVSIG